MRSASGWLSAGSTWPRSPAGPWPRFPQASGPARGLIPPLTRRASITGGFERMLKARGRRRQPGAGRRHPGGRERLMEAIAPAFLERVRVFSLLSREDVERVTAHLTSVELAEGQTLFHEGEPGNGAVHPRRGKRRHQHQSPGRGGAADRPVCARGLLRRDVHLRQCAALGDLPRAQAERLFSAFPRTRSPTSSRSTPASL